MFGTGLGYGVGFWLVAGELNARLGSEQSSVLGSKDRGADRCATALVVS